MGKKQHQKDRLHITASEWKRDFGGYKQKKTRRLERLPFNCCALTLTEFQDPFCTNEGIQFDILDIVPYIQKYHKNPVTGKPLAMKDLIKLNYSKNESGKSHCPLTYKVFNSHSHIVAIKTSGNVYSKEAIEKLNLKPKFYEDLLTGEKFTRSDVITIQDPRKPDALTVDKFDHIKRGEILPGREPSINAGETANRVLKKLKQNEEGQEEEENEEELQEEGPIGQFTGKRLPKKGKKNSNKNSKNKAVREKIKSIPRSHLTTGHVSGSFTSTTMDPVTQQQYKPLTEREIRERRYKKVKKLGKKAYISMETNKGDLNFQLEVERAPMTCHNFLLLAQRGYYDNLIFHRLIISFMIQGGDPKGTGRGGECAWGGKFEDEFHPRLRHKARGILSMANSGPGTNGSQFFITFGACPHLDDKHSVFGKLVGGMDILNRIETVKTDSKDRPKQKIYIKSIKIHSNPFDEPDETDEEEKERLKKEKEEEERKQEDRGSWFSGPSISSSSSSKSSVGKYLPASAKSSNFLSFLNSNSKPTKRKENPSASAGGEEEGGKKKKKPKITRFKDFAKC